MFVSNLADSLDSALEQALKNPGHLREPGVPYDEDDSPGYCVVHHFPQTWGSTALGFPGVGAQAVTSAYTTVIRSPSGEAAVYFAGKLAYLVAGADQRSEQAAAFLSDLRNKQMEPVATAQDRYGTRELMAAA